MSARILAAAALSTALALGQSTAATVADFGPLDADPLVVSGAWTCADGATFDCGGRTLVFAPGAVVTATNATFLAGEITAEAGSTVQASVRLVFVAGTPGATGEITVRGALSANGAGAGGVLEATAGGGLRVLGLGRIEARGLGAFAPGGAATLVAADELVLNGAATALDVSGGAEADGGAATLRSLGDDVTSASRIAATGGGRGGVVVVEAADDATLGDVDATGGLPPGAFLGGDGGSLTVDAGGDVTALGTLDVSVASSPWPAVAAGGSVVVAAGGDAFFGGVVRANGGAFSPAGAVVVAADGDFFLGAAASWSASNAGEDGPGGLLRVEVMGDLDWLGVGAATGGPSQFAAGGTVELIADGEVRLTGSIATVGANSGPALLASMEESVVVSGVVDLSSFVVDGEGGELMIEAAEDVVVSGTLDVAGLTDHTGGGGAHVMAGDRARFLGGAAVRLGGHDAGHFVVDGCRVEFLASALVDADGDHHGGHVDVSAGDGLQVAGTFSALPGGELMFASRLPAPYSNVVVSPAAAGMVSVVSDAFAAPCLARRRATLTATPDETVPGGQSTIALDGPPARAVIAFVALAPAAVGLGPFGFTQVDPTTALRLADPGLFGPPLPGSFTDAAGNWTFVASIPPWPVLAGLSLRFEAVIVDDAARNGLFHQPPAVEVEIE